MNDSGQEESRSRIESEIVSQKRDSDFAPSTKFGVSNRRGAQEGDELDMIKEEHSDRGAKDDEAKVGELLSVS